MLERNSEELKNLFPDSKLYHVTHVRVIRDASSPDAKDTFSFTTEGDICGSLDEAERMVRTKCSHVSLFEEGETEPVIRKRFWVSRLWHCGIVYGEYWEIEECYPEDLQFVLTSLW